MENFAQLHFYGQIHKNSSRIRILSENYRSILQNLSRIFYKQLHSRTVILYFGMQFVYIVSHS